MFTFTLVSGFGGTDRLLTVRDESGRVIGQCDPFADGIPADLLRRELALGKAAREIVHRFKLRAAQRKVGAK